MNATIFLEGGSSGKAERTEVRRAFQTLFKRCGFSGRLPSVVPCGPRDNAFDDFTHALRAGRPGFIALMVDSEDPMEDPEKPWEHLKRRDNWNRPDDAIDDQALLMTTCMETWFVADIESLHAFYGNCLNENLLPDMTNPESRGRATLFNSLKRATRDCSNAYRKGKVSFELVENLNPVRLKDPLPSFARIRRILEEKL